MNIQKKKAFELETKLYSIYGDSKIICSLSVESLEECYINNEKKLQNADILVKLTYDKDIVIIWDLKHRKDNNKLVKSYTIANYKKFENHKIGTALYEDVYKQMGTHKDDLYEKVVVMDFGTLNTYIEELYNILKFNSYDINFPNVQDFKIRFPEAFYPDRKKISTSMFKRQYDFRERVLRNYNYECAICRCKETKILEAAHIRAVKDYGSDETSNGICLCANHHKMLDSNLLQIDYKSRELSYISPSASEMPWYNYFIEQFGGLVAESIC